MQHRVMFRPEGPVAARVAVAGLVGIGIGVLAAALTAPRFAPPLGWSAASLAYVVWTWLAVGRMNETRTQTHATREDPTRVATDAIVLLASIASLAGVAYVLIAGSSSGDQQIVSAVAGVTSVAGAWFVVQTTFALRYASIYYSPPVGGIGFNQDEQPSYADFAYVAFTLGMTYQVSDTDLRSRALRLTALRHGLLSYLLGAGVLGVVINLVASLGSARGS